MRIAALLCVLGAGAVLIIWLVSGAPFVTRYQIPETVTTTDEFGDEMTQTEMKDGFELGLMPAKHIDGALPIGGAFAAASIGFFFLSRRR